MNMQYCQQEWRILLPFLFLFVLFFTTEIDIQAQGLPPLVATIQSPTNNSTNISRTPTITVRTSLPIYAARLNYQYPDKDSVRYNLRATIMVIPKLAMDSLPYQAWRLYAASGSLLMMNDTTLTFTVNHLKYSTDYRIIIDSLYGQYSGMPLRFPTVISSFRTIDPPHEIRATSLDGFNVINCNDKILVAFNRPVSSATTTSGPLLDLQRIISAGTTGTFQTAFASSIVGVTADPNVVFIKPTSAIPGQHYFLNIRTSYLNGDTNTNARLHFFVQNAFRVKIDAVLSNSPDTLPYGIKQKAGVGESYYDVGETVQLRALPELGNVRFVKWQCPQLPLLNNSTSNTFSFTQNCVTVTNISVTAVYEKMRSTTTIVQAEPGLDVFVYDRDHNLLGTTGTYTVLDSRRDSLIVRAIPRGSYTFDGWSTPLPYSPPPLPFNSSSGTITVKFSTRATLVRGEVWGNLPQAMYSLNGNVIIEDANGVDPASIYMYLTPESYEEPNPGSEPIGILLLNTCYEIYRGIADGNVVTYNPGTESATLNGQLKQRGNTVTFIIRKKRIHLRVDQVMLKNTQTEEEDQVTKVTHDNATEVYRFVNGQWEGPLVQAVQFDNGRPYKDYEFMCGDLVKVVCSDKPEKGHYFSHWSNLIAGYISPESRGSKVYQLTINENLAHFTAPDGHKQIRTRACFHMVFRLVEIGLSLLKTDGTFDLEYFPPEGVYVKRDDEPKDGRQVEFMTGEGTRIHLRFNQPYDKPSVEAINTSTGVQAIEISAGISGSPFWIPAKPQYNNISHIIQSGFQEANELVFGLHIASFSASKMGYNYTNVTAGIKSKNLTPLENPMGFTTELELPWVTLEYEKLKIHNNDEDPNVWLLFGTIIDRGDMYNIFQSGMMGPDGNGNGVITKTSQKGGIPECSTCNIDNMYQLEVGEEHSFNYTLLATGERMTHHGYIFSHIETKDRDGAELINFVGTVLSGVGDLIGELELPDLPESKDADGQVQSPSFWEKALYDNTVKIGSKLFNGVGDYLKNCSCNEDDHIGSAHLFLGKYDKWGKASGAANKMHFRDHNSEYWFRTTLN